MLNDIHKMINFISLSRDDFLQRYNYMSSLDYDITADIFYSDLQRNIQTMKQQIKNISDDELKLIYTRFLHRFIKKIKKS